MSPEPQPMDPSEEQSSDSCSVCSDCFQHGRYFNRDLPSIVHEDCSECAKLEINADQLCRFCSHIRPAHLLTCKGVEYYAKRPLPSIRIKIGTPAELELRQYTCAFCRWCLQVARADSRLCHYTVDEEKPIRIFRFLDSISHACIRRTSLETLNDLSDGWQPRLGLNVPSKTTRFASDSHPYQTVFVKCNKSEINLEVESSSVDWAQIRQWKASCEKEHRTCREIGTGKLPEAFRLIDVELESIVEVNFEPCPHFAALSYVWGTMSSNGITARRDNMDLLRKPGSLRHLPQTLAHAIIVCKEIGLRYLWVDRLCIIQDSRDDKYGQIGSLEAIYSRADLVVVAACGQDMHSGLFGVHDGPPKENFQIATNVFGFTMVNQLDRFLKATRSTWSQRGWTYQEAVLAKRKLYFTVAEVWFECVEDIQRDNTFSTVALQDRLQRNGLRTIDPRHAIDPHHAEVDGDVWNDYSRHLEQYSRRTLTYPSDVYNAFSGIGNALYSEGETIFGLPEADFSRALLWFPSDRSGLRERQSDDESVILPSWSWASIIGSICTSHCNSFGIFYCSLCEWATWIADNNTPRARRIYSINDEQVWRDADAQKRLYYDGPADFWVFARQLVALAWIKGCIEADVPPELSNPQSESIVPIENLRSRWPTVSALWAEVQRSRSHQEHPSAPISLRSGRLFTRTQWSVLQIEHDGDPDDQPPGVSPWLQPRFWISHREDSGKRIGALLGMAEYRLRSGAAAHDQRNDVNFISMAVGFMPSYITRKLDVESLKKNRLHKSHPKSGLWRPQPGVLVMAVRWEESIARRIAIGFVTLQGWVDSKPEFRTVVLA